MFFVSNRCTAPIFAASLMFVFHKSKHMAMHTTMELQDAQTELPADCNSHVYTVSLVPSFPLGLCSFLATILIGC